MSPRVPTAKGRMSSSRREWQTRDATTAPDGLETPMLRTGGSVSPEVPVDGTRTALAASIG